MEKQTILVKGKKIIIEEIKNIQLRILIQNNLDVNILQSGYNVKYVCDSR